uniref:Uroporphyrinogen decarboxylase (URO-D) domain-containing protein n=1 Tax=Glossina morsitans morsitans TaxID=37546 RepID=A0A1B0GAG7_GLOMM
ATQDQETLFAKGAVHSLTKQTTLGADVISLDWTVDPVKSREQAGQNITLQGNFDPRDMYKTPEEIRALVTDMARKFGKIRKSMKGFVTPHNKPTPTKEANIGAQIDHFLGNEQADRAAKYAASAPLMLDNVMERLDLQRYIGDKVKEKITEPNL